MWKVIKADKDKTKKIDVSIIIPARNEEAYIEKCLTAVFSQEITHSVEVLVIDSGSVDRTPEIVKRFKSVRLMAIRPEEFAHGRTRNLGVRNASGDFIVFLNADAIPVNKKWLEPLVDSVKGDGRIAGAFSRHLPRHDCHLYMVRDLQRAMTDKGKIKTKTSPFDFLLYSTVSSISPRSIWSQFPFDENITIAEDQIWAKKVLEEGFKIVYQPESMVYHSHNYSFRDLFRHKKEVGQTVKLFKNRILNTIAGFFFICAGMVVKIAGDFIFIFSSGVPLKKKIQEMAIAIGARFVSFLGKYAGWIKLKNG